MSHVPRIPDEATPLPATVEGLQHQNAALAEAVAARDIFISVAAHELRNPMTPIMGQIDLLLRGVRTGRCPPEQVEQRLVRIQHTMRRYLKRATVLLDVSRITSGRLKLEPEAFDLAALLRDVADELADAARHTGVAITIIAPEGLPICLDRLATEQILDNLVTNALKYGARTPVEVVADEHEGQLRIRVRDGGAGIPASERARVFERFERAVGQNERHSGFGVGLWVVRQLVQSMEGAIIISDAPGGGALFTVTLPLHMKEQHL